MKIIEVKCPNCGGNLTVRENSDYAVCEFCETSYFLDDMDEAEQRDESNESVKIPEMLHTQMSDEGNRPKMNLFTIVFIIFFVVVLIMVIAGFITTFVEMSRFPMF